MTRLIEKRDLKDMRKRDLINIILDNEIILSGILNNKEYDELVDYIVNSNKVYVETDEGEE